MELEIKLKSITHEDLVSFFSTSLFGNDIVYADYDRKIWASIPEDQREGTCFEDHLADMILNNKEIYIIPNDYDDLEENEVVVCPKIKYQDQWVFCLKLENILNNIRDLEMVKLLEDTISGEGDYWTAWELLQKITWGEQIFG